jgi:multidrug efflux system membrane fusion protein
VDRTCGDIPTVISTQLPLADERVYPPYKIATVADTLAVPSAAVLRNEQGDYVYRVNDDRTVSIRRIQAGASDGDWVAVQARAPDELKAGDRVVVDGMDRLREGASVDVIRPAGAGAAVAAR